MDFESIDELERIIETIYDDELLARTCRTCKRTCDGIFGTHNNCDFDISACGGCTR